MKLIFIYNANSGKMNAVLDSVHKVVSPATYHCNLCAITFDLVNEDILWKAYRENTKHELVFLHKDEFEKQFKSKWLPTYNLPIILTPYNHSLEVFISSEILNEMTTSEELIEEISKRTVLY